MTDDTANLDLHQVCDLTVLVSVDFVENTFTLHKLIKPIKASGKADKLAVGEVAKPLQLDQGGKTVPNPAGLG